ncbi:hypothetical protein [Rhodanobacter sp. FW106-PBR-R2A-1-13]|uniref:hypothetical protein n=1 Tax=Rhodanobacter sp. FW106-PBR-R2A-1-13 TaxID=3454845 RepID=UPI0034E4C0B9
MNPRVEAMVQGFMQGARETPRGFFAPVIVFFRWLDRLTDEEMRRAGPWSAARMADTLARAHGDLDRTRTAMFERLETLDAELHGLVMAAFGDSGTAAAWMDQALGPDLATPYQYLAAGNRARVVQALPVGAACG